MAAAQITSAPKDARNLMAQALSVEPSRMTLHLRDELTAEQLDQFWTNVRRRAEREPMSHILGSRLFYGRNFKITPDVLDPRGDTETLIEAALSEPFEEVLDLGTGSGCILVTLLAERSEAVGAGTDVSEAALVIANVNAKEHAVLDRCSFEVSNWFSVVRGSYDLIVSNPPYVTAEEMLTLEPELTYEPRMALTDEADGLTAYRRICAQAPGFLKPNGRILVEIGPTQGAQVAQMMADAGLAQVQVLPDLDSRDRVVSAHKPA
ncbi:peptide chain release factor N(5)-glutamine methyltransferase [Lentibacter algarum]|nr:peptide chain release factor N(5)-glutamine methyltransferase [Lentibacter algarum]